MMLKVSLTCIIVALDLVSSQNVLPIQRTPALVPRQRVPLPLPLTAPDNTVEEYPNRPPGPYNFGYDIKDEYGNRHFRKEESDGKGNIQGTYGYADSSGVFRFVEYLASRLGYRVNIKSNEPGVGNSPSADVNLIVEETPRGVLQAASNVNTASPVLPDGGKVEGGRERDLERNPERLAARRPASFYQWNDNKASASERAPEETPTPTVNASLS